ncbi:hypothetical protein [Actinacidiphila oryziradicis]|uniref:hypothetical protein n=1 Tax=Actinacidiphila oryziradicis TaxID=2571141 RepID=UPI001FECA64A|nr:hypothetical protein [Actinacidiphila oryziradicis]
MPILAFLAPRRPSRLFSAVSGAVRSVVAPAALVREQAPATAPDPTDVYAADDMPAVETIAAAAAELERSADQARRADRGKRAAKKVLDKLPAGVYGGWKVFRTPSSRSTPDLAEITRIFKANGLGKVPMRPCSPSLKVERVEALVLAEVA